MPPEGLGMKLCFCRVFFYLLCGVADVQIERAHNAAATSDWWLPFSI